MEVVTYGVPGVSCEHCRSAIGERVAAVDGVAAVIVDLERKLVTVSGTGISDRALREAIDDAGYDIVP